MMNEKCFYLFLRLRWQYLFCFISWWIIVLGDSDFGGDHWKSRYVPKDRTWMHTEQIFVYNTGEDPQTLDPHLVTSLDAMRIVDAIFEGLVMPDPSTLEIRPAASSRWESSPDGLKWTFYLRNDLVWQDGKPLTASEWVQSFYRAVLPSTAAPYSYLFDYIQNGRKVRQNQAPLSSLGVQAKDPNRIEIMLEFPCPYFLHLLTLPIFYPVRLDLLEKYPDTWMRPPYLIGNGPFILKVWRNRELLLLEKSKFYWDRDFVKLQQIKALCLADENTAYREYKRGTFHWLPTIPQSRIEELKRDPDYYCHNFFGTYFYRINLTRSPLNDRRVRLALSLAVHRRSITDNLLRGGQSPIYNYCPNIGGYQLEPVGKEDIQLAKQLLQEAGYPDGKGFPTIEILYNSNEGHKLIAEAIVDQWYRHLGIRVLPRNVEWKVFLHELQQLNYWIARSSWIGDYLDPMTFYECFSTDSGNNRTGWSSSEYDQLLSLANRSLSPQERKKYFQRMEELLIQEHCVIIPIYQYVNQGLIREDVCGFYENIRAYHPFKFIWLEKRP